MKYLLFTAAVLAVAISNGFATITCHKSVDAELPGADFNIQGITRRCINSASCVRSFGTINGKPGSFVSCVASENQADTCGNYPACKTVTTGSGETLNDYKICCCKTDLCNAATFEGETPETLAKANLIPQKNYDEEESLINKAIMR